MRLVDADTLIPKEVHTIIRLTATGEQTESVVYAEQIDKAPTVDAVERKRGRWISDLAFYDDEGCPCIVLRCSECGEPYPKSNFCPNCGAEMRKGEEE